MDKDEQQQHQASDEVMHQQEEPSDTEEQAPSSNLPALPDQLNRAVASFQGFAERNAERFDRLANYISPRNEEEEQAPENIARGPILLGMVTVIVFFGLFGLWSVLAPIASAAIAPGKVILDSNKKTIDHLEGGIVETILVREGQFVEAGQALIELDDTAAKARRNLYRGQMVAAQATEARLIAERDGAEELVFPPELLKAAKTDQTVEESLDAQRRLFVTRKESLEGRTQVLQQQIKQSEEEINGLEEQIKSSGKQLELLDDEIADVKYLLEKGNAAKTRLLALQRRKAEIAGEKGERQAMIARAQQRINEAKIEMYNLKTEMLNEVVSDLKETQDRISDLQEQLRAAEDVMKRIVIRTPVSGEVTGLTVHTVGGVIAPDEPIMHIVPQDDKLIVEARVKPQDIDVVHPGLKAQVRLSAYKVRSVPPVDGEVITVSADRFEDEQTGEPYFVARIAVDESALEELEGVELSPGMSVETLIVTGSRSLVSYLASPIRDSFNRAFREE